MIRLALLTLGLSGIITAAAPADSKPIPPPREIRSDGSRDPAPDPDPDTLTAKVAKPGTDAVATSENPAETVEKIIKNSKNITERLADSDTGKDTRKTQDETLALIDSLLNPPPPPPSGGGGSDDKKDMNDKKDMKDDGKGNDKKDMKDDGKGNDKKDMKDNGDDPKKGMDPAGGMQPQEDNKPGNGSRKPRMGSGDQQPDGKEPQDPGMNPPMKKPDTKNDPKNGMPMGGMPMGGMPMGGMPMGGMPMGGMPMGGMAGGNAGNPMGMVPSKPSLPIDDDVVKEVWGHLPDKLRQQVSQYYKEQFMPKYSDLLKQYYGSLANQNPKPLPEIKR